MTAWMDRLINLEPEQAFKYGSVTASILAGLVFGVKRLTKKAKKGCEGCGLCKNKLFVNLELWIREVQDLRWKCCNDFKTTVGKDLITIKLQAGIDVLAPRLCKIQKLEDRDIAKAEFLKALQYLVQTYTNAWIASGIDMTIIQDVTEAHDRNIKDVVKVAKYEFSKDYMQITEILRHCCNELISGYSKFLSQVRTVLDSSNGKLIGIKYKGTINNSKNCHISKETFENSFDEDALGV
jgi:uncharacterized protein YbcV (DUF1398 family)